MDAEPPLQEGDVVELLPGAPIPPHHYAVRPGARGQVLLVDAVPEHEATSWVTALFPGSQRPLRIHRRWLRRVTP